MSLGHINDCEPFHEVFPWWQFVDVNSSLIQAVMVRCHSSLLCSRLSGCSLSGERCVPSRKTAAKETTVILVSADRTLDDLAFSINYLGLTFHSKDHRELFFPFPDEKRALINFVSWMALERVLFAFSAPASLVLHQWIILHVHIPSTS